MLSSKQNYKSAADVNSQDKKDERMQNFLQVSELTSVLYDPVMRGIFSPQQAEIRQKLINHGIVYDHNKFYPTFQKFCIRTDWQSTIVALLCTLLPFFGLTDLSNIEYLSYQIPRSAQISHQVDLDEGWSLFTVYQVRYGHLKTELKTISVRLDFTIFCNNFLDRGSFGEILQFRKSNQQYFVLKNIKYQTNNAEKINLALQQVFYAKVFSALETGPKFVQLFSYDLIMFRNTVQFAMELCRTEYQKFQLEEEVDRKNLLELLKTIHSLGICHMDIKMQNLGWSPAFKKLVFLDFTFTRFVKEPIGYKGDYSYVSFKFVLQFLKIRNPYLTKQMRPLKQSNTVFKTYLLFQACDVEQIDKTMTGFFGTNRYSSPEMRKRFQLRNKSYVDLYYNDLHCLEQTWKEMRSIRTKSLHLQLGIQQCKNQKNYSNNQAILNYFEAKSCIFDDNFLNLTDLFKKDKSLRKTLGKLVRKYEKKRNISHDYRTCTCHNSVLNQEHPASLCQIDQILYSYEISTEENPFTVSLSDLLKEVITNDGIFKKAWKEDVYKQSMFFLIDVYSNTLEGEDNVNRTKKMVEKIYRQICSIEPRSHAMKFRQVLLYYAGYFESKEKLNVYSNPVLSNQTLSKNCVDQLHSQFDAAQGETPYMIKLKKIAEYYPSYLSKKNNIEVIEKIMGYFVLMQDGQTRRKLEDMVLSILEQQENYLEYNERNYKYFLTEIATMNPMSTWHYERYIQKSQNLIQQLSKKMQPTDSPMLQISKTLHLMKTVKNYRVGSLYKVVLEEEMRQIDSLVETQSHEIRQFTYCAIQYRKARTIFPAISMKNQVELKDHLLQKCALQIAIINCILTERIYSLRTMIESEQFLSKFLTLTHLNILNLFNKAEKQKRMEICENYLQIEKVPDWGLCSEYLWVMDQLHDKLYIGNYLLDWLSNLKMSDISNLERLQNLQIFLSTVIYRFLNMKFYSKRQKMPLEAQRKLGEIVLSFVQYTTDLPRILRKEAIKNNWAQVQNCIYFRQAVMEQMRIKDMYHKGMALLLLHRVEEATAIALEIAQYAIELQDYTTLFGFISFIWEYRQQNCMEQASRIILKVVPHFMKGNFRENLLQSHLCLLIVLKAYTTNGLFNEAFECIHELCCYVESRSINVTTTNIFLSMKKFILTLQCQEIRQFVHARIGWRLSQFICCPVMTYILVKTSLHLQSIPLDQMQRKRLIVIGVMFGKHLPYGFFAEYRQILYQQSLLLKKRKIRTLSELRRVALKKTLAVFTEAFSFPKKGRNRSLFSREAMREMIENTSRRVQDYYINLQGKIKAADFSSNFSEASVTVLSSKTITTN